ncbi:MAG: hypothetical protein IIA14_12945 [SAR324 cluster bacterium]|nr:hypothetical protein [SAR324 cluster bacterium]
MKRLPILLLIGLTLAWPSAFAEELGAFFTKVNTYTYPNGPGGGQRVLIRARKVFAIVNLTTDESNRLWYQILEPRKMRRIEGEGWTPLAPHEVLADREQIVEIFPEILENPDRAPATIPVRAGDLEMLSITAPSRTLPQITWQKVRYKTREPLRLWIRAATGIARPAKSVYFLTHTYEEMVSRTLPREKLDRLLSGVIRVGDTTLEVEWALGKPLRIQDETILTATRTTWHYPSIVVQFKNQLVEQVN